MSEAIVMPEQERKPLALFVVGSKRPLPVTIECDGGTMVQISVEGRGFKKLFWVPRDAFPEEDT